MDSLPIRDLEQRICLIRGQRVMLDFDLAMLYGVETWNPNKAVKRNAERFPSDFMFQLSVKEAANLTFQFGRSSSARWGGRRRPPFAFTEQGVAMLSGVLNSPRAVQVNVAVMRAFVKLRGMVAAHEDLSKRLDELEKKYSRRFKIVFEAIRELMEPSIPPHPKIGFRIERSRSESCYAKLA